MTLFGFNTTNSIKVLIMLYELKLPFKSVCVKLDGQQYSKDFKRINANCKTPVLQYKDSASNSDVELAESGAILFYLNQLPQAKSVFEINDEKTQLKAVQWLMWQVSTQAPNTGNLAFFLFKSEKKIPVAIKRYSDENLRQLDLVEQTLSENEYLAGYYSIADIALFSWYHKLEHFGFDLTNYPNIKAWLNKIHQREAVKKALAFDFLESESFDSYSQNKMVEKR